MPRARASIVLLLIAIASAFATVSIRTRPGIAQTNSGGEALLTEPAALYRAVRVARAVAAEGWVSSWERSLAPSVDGSQDVQGIDGARIPGAPGYDLVLACIARRAPPSVGALLEGGAEPGELPAVGGPERAEIERIVALAPAVFAALTALLAALLAAQGLRGPARSAAAAVAGLGVAFTWTHVAASASGTGSSAAWISMLLTAALLVTVRAWSQPLINQPFRSSLRGGLAGLLVGLALASDAAVLVPILLLQLSFVARLVIPFREEDGRRVPARSFPVFVTSFHKVALLVSLPAAVENPFVSGDPVGIVGVTWLPLVALGAGWLAFAPFALVPKLVARRPLLALLPAAALLVAAALSTPALGRLLLLLQPEVRGEALPWTWLVALVAALVLGLREGGALRRPEVLALAVTSSGLAACAGRVEASWGVAPVAALVGVVLVDALVRLLAWRSQIALLAALAVLLVLAAFDPRTLEAGERPGEAHQVPVPDLMAEQRRIDASDSPRWVLNEPHLGGLLLWRSDLLPARVWTHAGIVERAAARSDEQALAYAAGYRWSLPEVGAPGRDWIGQLGP